MNDEKTDVTLTKEEAAHVYNRLVEVDDSAYENLKRAHEMTENSDYKEIEEMPDQDDTEDTKNTFAEDTLANSPKEMVKQAIITSSEGTITEAEAEDFLNLLIEYQKCEGKMKVYDRLPASMKKKVDAGVKELLMSGTKGANKELVAKYVIDGITSEVLFSSIFDDINKEIHAETRKLDEELSAITASAYEELNNKLEELRETDPEKAKKIEKLQAAIERSKSFDTQLEYLKNDTLKNIKRYPLRYNDEVYQFNKIVNTTDIKIPNVDELYEVIKLRLPNYTKDQIRSFIVLLCRSTKDLDLSELDNLAYVFKLIDSIYRFKFITAAYEDENSERIFNGISEVISQIENYKQGR